MNINKTPKFEINCDYKKAFDPFQKKYKIYEY